MWQLGALDERGRKQGAHSWLRVDGTLHEECVYVDDQLQGCFVIYHPNGQIARRGAYEAGEVDGEVTAYASDEATPEHLRGCCVPPGAWEMRATYSGGEASAESFFDRSGRGLLSDGRVRPERPACIAEDIEYDEMTDRFRSIELEGEDRRRYRYFSELGVFERDAVYVGVRLVETRSFDSGGECYLEVRLDAEGRRSGTQMRRYLPGEPSPYANRRIVSEQGECEGDQPVGEWLFRDHAGHLVQRLDYGVALQAQELDDPVFTSGARDADYFAELARRALGERRLRHALCAVARAAACSGNIEPLRDFLATHALELEPAFAGELRDRVVGEDTPTPAALLGAVLLGGDPPELLRVLASALPCPQAVNQLAEAAVLLDPDRPRAYLTRGLSRVELGDVTGVRADAERLGDAHAEGRDFMLDYARLLFPEWSFWPAGELLEGAPENLPDAVLQPLEAVQRVVQIYATRLLRLREGARARCTPLLGEPAWLPPQLDELLPHGPLELERFSGSITDETDAGDETVLVEVDERLDLQGLSLTAIQRLARRQWAALTWLCWACGGNAVAWPRQIHSRAEFAAALGLVITRAVRARDALETGGLRSITQGVPGFSWQGLAIDTMHPHLAKMAIDEYAELRAVFLWLAFAENLSPFQNDLREM